MSRCLKAPQQTFVLRLLYCKGKVVAAGWMGLEFGVECGGTRRSQETIVLRILVLYDAQRRTSWEICRVPLANIGGHKH